jgi:hypothetical protein
MSNAHDSHGPDRYARHYVPDRPVRRIRQIDRDILRQVLGGGAVVVGVELVTEILAFLGNLSWGFGALAAVQLGSEVGGAVLFAAVVSLTTLYVLPLESALGTSMVLSRVAVGGGIATAFLAGATTAWIVLNTSGMLGSAILSGGIMRPIATGLVNTALFALGVLVIRSLPGRPRDVASVAPLPPA